MSKQRARLQVGAQVIGRLASSVGANIRQTVTEVVSHLTGTRIKRFAHRVP